MAETIYRPLQILPGVQPLTDATALNSNHWRYTLHCRFVNGNLEKIGGWTKASFYRDELMTGVCRSLFSLEIQGIPHLIAGTNTRLYDISGGQLTNITPFQTSSVAATNSLSTQYGTLPNNPIFTIIGDTRVVVTDPDSARYKVGDIVTLSGATTTGGITTLNGPQVVRSLGVGLWTFRASMTATSSSFGGGASVIRSSGIVRVTTANTMAIGDRVKISGATATGGITAPQLNAEFVTRNNTSTYFDISTTGTATSSVTSSGGSVVYFNQLAAGPVDEVSLQGYGAGLYGVGLYGTALTSSTGKVYPRIWFSDNYGDELITTPGNGSPVYRWGGVKDTAPTPVANAPTDVNYSFISDNTLITFGSDGVENRIAASDQGNITQWTSSSLNQVFRDDIEGAGRLLTHLPLRGSNIIFTEQKSYTFRKISLEAGVWEIKILDPNIGIIAPMARCTVRGIGFWMSSNNFHMYRGGNVETVPSNNPKVPNCTALKYVFENLNYSQKSKIFGWYNPKFDEVWFNYPSASSNEPDSVIRVCLTDFTWSIDKLDRTAAEYPSIGAIYPRMTDLATNLYYHESGNDNDTVSLPWSAKSPFMTIDKGTTQLVSFIPDSTQTSNINVNVQSRLFPQSTKLMYNKNYTVTPTYENMQDNVNGRYWDYTLSGDSLNQLFRMGLWQEELAKGPPK